MKRLSFTVSIFLFVFPSIVMAQTPMDSGEIIRPFGINKREEVREVVQRKLEEVRQNRAEVLKRIEKNKNLDNIIDKKNERWIQHANNVLERLSLILAKIETRAELYAENGHDISAVTKSITEAQTAIQTAQQTVTQQSERSYTDAYSSVSNLKEDLSEMMNLVRQARTEVQQALRSLQLINTNQNAKQ